MSIIQRIQYMLFRIFGPWSLLRFEKRWGGVATECFCSDVHITYSAMRNYTLDTTRRSIQGYIIMSDPDPPSVHTTYSS